MVSTVLASILENYLGQYLELSDSSISVGSEVSLQNVKLKESALSDLGLPVKCLHGKVSKLLIKIPWFSLFTSKTTIELDGLHLLVVPSTSVNYDEDKEDRDAQEAKQKRLQRAEDAKKMREAKNSSSSDNESAAQPKDTFVTRLGANIIKNLEIKLTRVHIRYEDNGHASAGYPFATGITLQSLLLNTKSDEHKTSESDAVKLKIFEKHVILNSLALYWRPRANLYSSEAVTREEVIDVMFNSNIGTKEQPIAKLKYLLGPISLNSRLKWCLSPELYSFQKPQLDLTIDMEELRLSLTKYQYHDFLLLLQSFEYISRGSQFRKYKARYSLENLPNYRGRGKDLWHFAFDSIFEENVLRRFNNWSWAHIQSHTRLCKRYRAVYKLKLSSGASKCSKETLAEIKDCEKVLDEINIRIQRQLAEREVDRVIREEDEKPKSKGWFGGWFGSSSENDTSSENSTKTIKQGLEIVNKDMHKLGQALSQIEKHKLYAVLDYQENAHHGIYPKSYVAKKMDFLLDRLILDIRDDDLNNEAVLTLELSTVKSSLAQRPSADNVKFIMNLEKLTVRGFRGVHVVNTKEEFMSGLLNFRFENNPPANPDLDNDETSLYDQRIELTSSPLEFMYDSDTVYRIREVFKTTEELNLANLQQTAASYLNEYRQTSTLTLQYVIDNQNLIDVNICFNSCVIILPMHGKYSEENCPVAVVNLGRMVIKSEPISTDLRSLTNKGPEEFNIQKLTETLRSQVYYKFNLSLENMQMLVSIDKSENWRKEIKKNDSSLFLLSPTSIYLKLESCVIKNDPELPLYKIGGNLDSINISIVDYRLIKLAKIVDTIIDAQKNASEIVTLKRSASNESMVSALSSFANSGSFATNFTGVPTATSDFLSLNDASDANKQNQPMVNMTDLTLNFNIGIVYLKISHLKSHKQKVETKEEEDIFYFKIRGLESSAVVRKFATIGKFHVGGISCKHLLLTTPTNEPVQIIQTEQETSSNSKLLSLTYVDANKDSPEFSAEYSSTIKKVSITFNDVHLTVHQDALLDIIGKINKLVEEISSNSKNISAMGLPAVNLENKPTPDSSNKQKPKQPVNRLTSQLSIKTTANIGLWALRAKKRSRSIEEGEVLELKILASLKSVSFDFMTSQIHLARVRVKNLEAAYVQRESDKIITAKLVDFSVLDGSRQTIYPLIVQSMDERVFDAKIRLFNNLTSQMKMHDPTLIDLQISAHMGRVRLVFLMKFLNDFLAFLEPFSTAKEIVAEKANDALEEASKTISDAYANAVRAQLDIQIEAPHIIIPVFSRSKTALSADLGTFSLSNRFKRDATRTSVVYDEMRIDLKDLNLHRIKTRDEDNKIVSSIPIVKPITFELDILRNMAGVKSIDDPAEITIQGTLHSIKMEMSKGDYNVIMAILSDNFSESGAFATLNNNKNSNIKSTSTDKGKNLSKSGDLSLPVKARPSSRCSMSSSGGSVKSLNRLIASEEKHPEAKAVDFSFKFLGFEAEIFANETVFDNENGRRPLNNALAQINLEYLVVDGSLRVNSSLVSSVYIKDCVLRDSRQDQFSGEEKKDNLRIVKFMEAKKVAGKNKDTMIDIQYCRDAVGNSEISTTIHSFILVGSVSYLLDIAYFFIPDQSIEWATNAPAEPNDKTLITESESLTKMTFYLQVEEPDIFLVENIRDVETESLLLNTKLQFKYWATSDGVMSIIASLTDIRCHTCRFNSALREKTAEQILQPCTVSLQMSQNKDPRTSVNANFSDLCVNLSPRSIKIIQNSIAAFLDSMQSQGTYSTDKEECLVNSNSMSTLTDLSQLWHSHTYKEDRFWFLRPEERDTIEATEEAIELYDENIKSHQSSSIVRDEQAIINVNNLIVKIGSGIAAPSILIETSLNCDVRNWSSDHMSALGTVCLEVAYFNSKFALWEPVIEPVAHREYPDSQPVYKRWAMNVSLHNSSANDFNSAVISPSFDETDGFICPELMPALSSISFVSREILEITVTKSFLSVLNGLSEAFFSSDELKDDENRKEVLPPASLIIKNRLGKNINIQLESQGFKYSVFGELDTDLSNNVSVSHNSNVHLLLQDTDKSTSFRMDGYISPLREQSKHFEAAFRLKVDGENRQVYEIPISKSDERFFPFPFRGCESSNFIKYGIVSKIEVENECKFVTLGSIVRFKNYYRLPMEIFISNSTADQTLRKLIVLSTDELYHVPIGDLNNGNDVSFGFRVSEPGCNIGIELLRLNEFFEEPISKTVQFTNCTGRPDIFLNLEGLCDEVFLEKSMKLGKFAITIEIRPVIIFKNCLPTVLYFSTSNEDEGTYIDPGKTTHFRGLKFGETSIQFKIFEFRNLDWISNQVLNETIPELSLWKFESISDEKQKFDLGVHFAMSNGTRILSLYSPFWMINKTGKNLSYKSSGDSRNFIHHPCNWNEMPLMFSYSARSLFGKRQCYLKIEDSNWSEPFTLNTIEDAGKVTCKLLESSNTEILYVGVKINLSKSSLTNIISFTPYYMILNRSSDVAYEIAEYTNGNIIGSWAHIEPGECMPFWPKTHQKVVARACKADGHTKPFAINYVHSTMLMLGNSFGGVYVECRISASETLLSLSPYKKGFAPVRLINQSNCHMIEYSEVDQEGKQFLAGGETCLFTWINPSGSRKLLWSICGYSQEYEDSLEADGQGNINLDNGRNLSWVSFLDGMQRTLLFSQDVGLCFQLAHSTGEFERINQEIDISIEGIGISLIHNEENRAGFENKELLYASVSSSEIMWECRKSGKTRYRPLSQKLCKDIEADFQVYVRERSVGRIASHSRNISNGVQVNYLEEKIFSPIEGKLRRNFQRGLWLQARTSAHQRQFHAKLNRIQIDNQLRECLFPVIFAPVPPPKSVMANSIPKPFIELSILEYISSEHRDIRQYEYFHALVQECGVKIDQGMINALVDFFYDSKEEDLDVIEFLKEDLSLASKGLKDFATLTVTQGQKNFYDYLHFSPLKVHVSFSLTSYKATANNGRSSSNFISLLLQSLGVTITDTDDIIFRLAYFERRHNFYSSEDLFYEMVRHYSSQAIKQIYVLIFGLDVIGNPFGLVVGVANSVEDLFYEPFQGAVEGPSEFAEGLGIGVRSVFSGVVGGAAGTVSRIAGALGKGFASLTFDEKFQNKRREAIKKRSRQNFGASIARSGKGLVMGFSDGFIGLAAKPIEGIMEEHAIGFLKGAVKGTIGVVARPVGGIMDFVSGTFDSFKRVTEVSHETVRVRSARFLHPDGIVRYYDMKSAQGNKVLNELDKGHYAKTDYYITHEDNEVDKGSGYLVTNKRILSVVYNTVMGSWSVGWEFEYCNLSGPPTVGMEEGSRWYLLLKPKEESRRFLAIMGSANKGKKMYLRTRDSARNLARIIEKLRTSFSD